jgi:hypothetical protein
MAKTVAEIDGDSSGLVTALNKGNKALGDMATDGGKKLTDQLREVADQADIAAGNLINKVGGPGAIAAIGGVGIAFTGAKAVVGAFLDSSEKLFRSYGTEGQKVWEGLERQMDGVAGAFAKAALGGGDMNQQAERMSQLLGTTASAADAALSPLSAIADAFFDIAYWESEATKEAKKFADQTAKAKDAADAAVKQAATEKERYKGILQDAAKDAGAGNLVEIGKSLEKAITYDKAALTTRQSLAAKYEYEIRQEWSEGAERRSKEQNEWAARQAQSEVDAMKGVLIDNQPGLLRLLKKHGDEQVMAELAILKEGANNLRDAAAANLDVRQQQQEALEKFGTGATPTRTSSIGSSKPSAEEDPVEREKRELKEIADLKYANDKNEQAMQLDALKRELDARKAANDARMEADKEVAAFGQQMLEEAAAERLAKGILTKEEQDALDQERLESFKARAGEEMGIYMQNAGKQLLLGKLSAKAASDMARSALGNIIIGKGDEAMAKAGIMAAELNPLAIPMAAAGLAAYAIGNAMMPTAKPSAGATPATEKPADGGQAASNNYSFNMRVDSVFADGESVARQFAMMQESARARGLLMQGA